MISIHAPRMGSDRFGRRHRPVGGHFNPRSPDGERQNRKRRSNQMKDFNPRSPDGERHTRRLCRTLTRNFNPRSPDGERHGLPCGEVASRFISIHTPRMGSDLWTSTWRCPSNHFNPRSPDGERPSPQYRSFRPAAISIHAPRMGSDCKLPGSGGACTISIHAPRMGSDYCGITCTSRRAYFNPRSPDGERPRAPRCSTRTSRYFNPRSPDGERRLRHRNTMVTEKFQSTLPGWGATRGESNPVQSCRISIHAPRMGSDASVCRRWFDSWHFNPRSPDGERHGGTWACATRKTFQSTLPGWGATRQGRINVEEVRISIHAPRMGSDCR